MAEVILKNIEKRYGDFVAVADFDLTIENGEFLVLVGPSGCGKSTTLRMVAGLDDPTGGEIHIGNKNVTDLEPKDRDIAMVFQSYALYPHKNVYENMAFALRIKKLPKEEIDARVKKAAEMLGISHLLHRQPKELSGGQRQRVALGRAIVRQPAVFLMDEPLSNLDAKLRVVMRAELIKLHRKLASTVIYVTHDQTEAMTMGSRIVVMKDGHIMQIGKPTDIYDSPKSMFVAGFIGSPPMNFLKGTLYRKESAIHFKTEGVDVPLPSHLLQVAESYLNKEVLLGIRPENLYPACENDHEMSCLVEVVEHVGAEYILHAKTTGDTEIVMTMPAKVAAPQIGCSLLLKCEKEKIHLFDPESGHSLTIQPK
ncbi:ABC transporter ATP-binding protein [Desulforamulus ruminis]|uniref:ABC transporter related protein n=1 Tax=Desulforamulus ruminis (strain ATCC 23193 / DSM 2154 / NCIMB 8452 / DL) TaxID=696281 RepID=F6DQR2_DESRL|nr:ABC transporter ATP-binding protein [Desulforamulus ruminis]AEG62059.1 ABC transporter related protein [Desulforamulus ruminis DSM 2154]